jgi:glycosyltransferase involved in cell wall biosynthesis
MNFSEDNFIVGYVGRDDKFKDINTLINAIEIVSLLNLNIKFVLMGNKLDNENIKFIKILHKWSSSIRLLGGGFDSYEIMPVFDLLVLSSKSEAFPNVVGEGMSMSIPCISTSVGEISQLINDCGWLIPVGDSNILSDKIVEAYNLFLNNKKYWNELRFKSRNRIIKYFNIDLMLYRYNNLWENF